MSELSEKTEAFMTRLELELEDVFTTAWAQIIACEDRETRGHMEVALFTRLAYSAGVAAAMAGQPSTAEMKAFVIGQCVKAVQNGHNNLIDTLQGKDKTKH